ncbi:MAG: hypothetical protein ACRYGG_18945 [Janthinobacterium lividum]
MTSTSTGSLYFPTGTGLTAADGSLVTVNPASALSGGVLTLPSGGSTAGVAGGTAAPDQYLITIYNGGAQGGSGGSIITTPYFFTIYAERAGTIQYARFAMQAADGANFQATIQVIPLAGGASARPVPVTFAGQANPLYASDGEGPNATNVAGYPGSGQGVLTYTASGSNSYQVGDLLQVTFAAVGGTFQCMSVQLGVTH